MTVTAPDERARVQSHDATAVAVDVPAARRLPTGTAGRLALGVVIVASVGAAVLLHRSGHTQGDDFALYLRQARSVFDGDVGQVVADNRFSVLSSDPGFSPVAYPWGWPLLLSPFVRWWGLDYDRLKLLEVAAFAGWMVLVHGIVRRRGGSGVALAIVAVLASAPLLLAHTDQLLSEYPHALAVTAFVWWLDRVRRRHPWTSAKSGELAGLGALAALAFNVRRESVVLVVVIVAAQVVDVVPLLRGRRAVPWRLIAVPHGAFVACVVVFQLLLPSTLVPDGNGGLGFVAARIGDYTSVLAEQLGFGSRPAVGVVVLVAAGAGMVIGCWRRPARDVPLAALTILSAVAVSTHFRMVDRYYLQIAPWVTYFAVVAMLEVGQAIVASRSGSGPGRARSRAVTVGALSPLLVLSVSHATVLWGDIGAARDLERAGRVQNGPTHPAVAPVFDAVRQQTRPGDVVAFFRARTMTLLTDRRSIQTTSLDRVRQTADWFAQRKDSSYWQPSPTASEARAAGLIPVWEDHNWILWRVAAQLD